MCNNNRPKLTPEQKMINAIFGQVVGEEVYKVEDRKITPSPRFTLDPDVEGEYMMDICRYLRCVTDDLDPDNPETFVDILDHIGDVMQVLKDVMQGSITAEQQEDIEKWQQYLEAR